MGEPTVTIGRRVKYNICLVQIYPHIHTPIPTSHTHTQMCNTHTDLRYYWLECRMLRDRWSCSTGHMGREDTNLRGNQYIEYREKSTIHAGACFVYRHKHPCTCAQIHILALCPVQIFILISKWKLELGTRLHPHPDTNTPIPCTYSTHTQTCVR